MSRFQLVVVALLVEALSILAKRKNDNEDDDDDGNGGNTLAWVRFLVELTVLGFNYETLEMLFRFL